MKSHQKISVYYDGLCKICSREINHYRLQKGADLMRFVDICATDFDAEVENVNPIEVHKVMHVRRADGSLAIKVDAFIEIWKHLPKYRFLSVLGNAFPVRSLLNVGYEGFTILRPYLPRYKNYSECSDSPYCLQVEK